MSNSKDAVHGRIQLEKSWKELLLSEFEQDYMQQLRSFLLQEKLAGKTIYPTGNKIFNAFNSTALDKVKVIILGQDPYHGADQAHGLCFSVPETVKPPPSLVNIFKEMQADLGVPFPEHGCLSSWADQGVLLLNSVLTVEQGSAASHQGQGWEIFTDRVIELLNEEKEGLVFLLWGSYAQKKGQFINIQKHLVLQSAHPSPLSAHRGFLGNKHFSKTNEFLISQGIEPIQWKL